MKTSAYYLRMTGGAFSFRKPCLGITGYKLPFFEGGVTELDDAFRSNASSDWYLARGGVTESKKRLRNFLIFMTHKSTIWSSEIFEELGARIWKRVVSTTMKEAMVTSIGG